LLLPYKTRPTLRLLPNHLSLCWSQWVTLMFVLAALTYAHGALRAGPRSVLVVVLVTVWALRLSLYITWRN